MVVHVACIRARWRRDHAKSHAIMPLCMALTNDLSSSRETHNILIQHTLWLNLMPFAEDPTFWLIRIFGEAEGREPPVGGIDLGRRVCRFTVKHVTHAGARRLG
jgi:hypothetical protein